MKLTKEQLLSVEFELLTTCAWALYHATIEHEVMAFGRRMLTAEQRRTVALRVFNGMLDRLSVSVANPLREAFAKYMAEIALPTIDAQPAAPALKLVP